MDNKKEEVLRMLAKAWSCDNVREDEFTVADFVRILNSVGKKIGKSHIQRKLKDMVDAGKLKVRSAKNPATKATCNAYSPPEGKSWEDVLQYLKDK